MWAFHPDMLHNGRELGLGKNVACLELASLAARAKTAQRSLTLHHRIHELDAIAASDDVTAPYIGDFRRHPWYAQSVIAALVAAEERCRGISDTIIIDINDTFITEELVTHCF